MGIASVNSPVNSISTVTSLTNELNVSAVKDIDNQQNTVVSAAVNQPSESDLKDITEKLNNFMQSIATDIRFELHADTNTLMVQVEESKTHKILKEVPAHELLDMVTKIRECIGAFVDKKV